MIAGDRRTQTRNILQNLPEMIQIMKMMEFIIFDPLELDLSYSAMFKVTRRAFKLQRCSYRVIRVQGGASWRDPRLDAKLAWNLQNDDFSDFKVLQ